VSHPSKFSPLLLLLAPDLPGSVLTENAADKGSSNQWFGSGAIAVPLFLWVTAIPGAYLTTGASVWEPAGKCAAGILVAVFLYANRMSASQRAQGRKQREERNNLLQRGLLELDKTYVEAPPPGERELDLPTLRRIQHLIDMAYQDNDDWTWYTKIDQFQTSALRYQLYEIMYCLGVYQGIYAPNAHAYISEAFRRIIEKSLTPTVLNFWKWERLLGNFTTDCDPVKRDNIMVTGFFLEGLMLYIANTRDERYSQPGSLRFQVTKDRVFEYDIHTMWKAIMDQWKQNPYCLFPCEPNWIYTPCNFQGLIGSVLYERHYGGHETETLLPIFEESLNRNFTEENGSILPIRSELSGFTLPGLCGALGDVGNAMFTRATFPHMSRRFWTILRQEHVVFDRKSGKIELRNLKGADKIDPGNYRPDPYAIYPFIAQLSAEYGDEEMRKAALNKTREGYGSITTPTGAVALPPGPKGPSNTTNASVLRAELLRGGDWKRLITQVCENLRMLIETPSMYPDYELPNRKIEHFPDRI
jgi:hypothetical protein